MAANLELGSVVDRFYGSLYRFGLSLTGSEADACDLVQQTFYIWLRKGRQLEQPEKVKGWLFTTLHREFLQSHRRSTRFPHIELGDAEAELPTIPPERLARIDAQGAVRALQKLDASFHAVVALFYLEDYAYEQIAEILELPLGTVKSRLSRGISQLRRLLAGEVTTREK